MTKEVADTVCCGYLLIKLSLDFNINYFWGSISTYSTWLTLKSADDSNMCAQLYKDTPTNFPWKENLQIN